MNSNQDLKILIKTKSSKREVDSPHAKYNSRGELMCLVCKTQIKSAIVWQAHEKKRSHLNKVTRLQEKQQILNAPLQRRYLDNPISNLPKPSNETKTVKPKGILKKVSQYDSSEDEESHMMEVDHTHSIKEEKEESFDQSSRLMKGQDNPSMDADQSVGNSTSNAPASSSGTLPEGFFDDPVADAKARNVEYRDKDQEEWLAFMKEVSAVEVESRQIIAEDKEEAAIETQIEQASDQIRCLERVVELDKEKKNHFVEKIDSALNDINNDSSDEEFSPIIWRTKNSFI